jgi:hypothetical protein
MKTDEQTTQTHQELYENATRFLNTVRGKYIVGQALAVAIKQLSSVPEPHKEKSNIRDMIFLLDNVFPLGKIFFKTKEQNTQTKTEQ